jgi:hypothetical protein
MLDLSFNSKTLLVIDRTVDSYEQLVAGTVAETEVMLLDPNRDGIEQITEFLGHNPQTRSLHIISHGSPGCLHLGNSHLGLDNIETYASLLQTWKRIEGRQILLYGCNVAAGEAGEAFVTRLHRLTECQIAASATFTGNAAAGGNWELEVKTSDLEIPLAIAPSVREAYAGVLATLTVTTLVDENNGTGAVSLREAIAQANTTAGADTIVFASSLSGTIALSLGQLTISDALTIDGLGANVLTVSGNNASRVFYIQNAGVVNIEGLTITKGSGDNGGGVKNVGSNLTISNSAIARNRATVNGGGVYSAGDTATTTISNSTLFGNTAVLGGGLFTLSGTASLNNSTISGNTASNGGGVFNNGTVNISSSTFSDNTGKSGGGLYNKGTASLSNSTISGNTASNGGGIFNYKGTASLSNSTISGNTASFNGGGILNAYGTANVTSTIIAANNGNKDIGGPTAFTSGGNNLIGNGAGAGGFSNGVKNDLVGTAAAPLNPQLGSLANNGGPTQTQALLPGSPALNSGSNPDNLITDQRGLPRTSGGTIDIGAFEVITSLTVDTLVDENDGNFGPGDLSLREAIAFIAAGGTINFANSLKGGTITLSLGQLLINQALTINGLGASNLTVSGNNASRVFYLQNAGTVNINGLTITGGNAYDGGGVNNNNSNLTLTNSTISGNSAGLRGGGIYNNQGTTSVSNSTISGNTAVLSGGGICNYKGTTNVSNSTISGNSAAGGGGIGNYDTVSISNSTISGNSARSIGGGISNTVATTNISNSTISGNSAAGSSQTGGSGGGGIYNNSGSVNITSTIIAANSNNLDIGGINAFTSGGNNLIGNGDGAGGFSNGVKNDIVGTTANPINPGLGPIFDYGGPTQTQGLLPGSPALNAGSNPNNLLTDQRGAPRTSGDAPDIGAFELLTSLTVDTLVDENDGNFAPGDLSLREAIALFLNFSNEGGTINFANSLSGGTITLSLGQLLIEQSLIINGLGASNLTLSGNKASRVFAIYDAGTVNINSLTITGGSADKGGGVKNVNSNLTLSNSTITGNTASVEGGGIFNQGTASISNSTISGNSANGGGGIFNDKGTASISSSTISGNSAGNGSGGGIFNYQGTTSVSNSTLSGNTASLGGGGILNQGTASVSNSTLSGNSANIRGGGGIYNSSGSATVTSTIIAANTNNEDIAGAAAFTSGGNNLIGNKGDAEGFINEVNEDIVGTAANPINPQLGPLANNGGPTQTQALLLGSPAIKAGSNPNNLTTDQRGLPRTSGGATDIGAFEVQYFSSLTVDTVVDENDGNFSPGDISLREAIAFIAPDGTINFAASLTGGTITLSLGQLLIDQSLTINGLGASNLTISGNNASRVFAVYNAGTVNISGLTITGGKAAFGGGVRNLNSNLTLSNSAISGNSAEGGPNGTGAGGGIYNAASGTVSISNSTVSGNTTVGIGGGIYNSTSGTVSISNSTVSGNTATYGGGGIYNKNTVSISNSTVSGNTANFNGGGIYSNRYSIVNVTSTIIAGNSSNRQKDIGGPAAFTSGGNNLIGNGDGASGFSNGVKNDIVGTAANPINPQLGPLANNGGPTQTQALLPGSPALNAGSNPNNLTTDQRGTGFNREVGGQTDIGAFEEQNPSPTVTIVRQSGTHGGYIMTGNSDPNLLKGSRNNDTLTGGGGNDTLQGGKGDDLLDGGAGADRQRGGQGADTFSYPLLSDSLLSGFDRIRDLVIGTDSIDGPNSVSAANLKELGAVASLNRVSISAVLSASNFGANGAATFTFGSRQFLALNDAVAGFSVTSDGMIEITGFQGNLTDLAII